MADESAQVTFFFRGGVRMWDVVVHALTKAAVQDVASGLMIGVVRLVGGRVRCPATVAAEQA